MKRYLIFLLCLIVFCTGVSFSAGAASDSDNTDKTIGKNHVYGQYFKYTTRVPSRNGDIDVKAFPKYDTGVNAKYSYQSDNLRIAIDVHTDEKIPEVLYIADVWIKNIYAFRTCFSSNKYIYDMDTNSLAGKEDGPTMAKRNEAIFAINGCYNVGLTVHSGIVYGMEDQESSGCLILYRDGSMRTFNTDEETIDIEEELKKGMYHAWQFGPVLVHNGERTERGAGKITTHPRTAVGYYEPGHYVFVVCDGRSPLSKGMTFDEIREVMYSLGVKEAINFDGGYSSVMIFMGEMINRNTYWGINMETKQKYKGRPIPDLVFFSDYDTKGSLITLEQIKARNEALEVVSKFSIKNK